MIDFTKIWFLPNQTKFKGFSGQLFLTPHFIEKKARKIGVFIFLVIFGA
ncbi:hypothetical protein [Flavobacterium longum]